MDISRRALQHIKKMCFSFLLIIFQLFKVMHMANMGFSELRGGFSEGCDDFRAEGREGARGIFRGRV